MASRQVVIAEENSFYSHFPALKYGKSSFYGVPNYDTRIHNDGVYIYGSSNATSEDFENLQKEYLEESKKLIK